MGATPQTLSLNSHILVLSSIFCRPVWKLTFEYLEAQEACKVLCGLTGSLWSYNNHVFRGHNFYEGAANSLSSANISCTSLCAGCQNVGGGDATLAALRELIVSSALKHRSSRMEKAGTYAQPEPNDEGICRRAVYFQASTSNTSKHLHGASKPLITPIPRV